MSQLYQEWQPRPRGGESKCDKIKGMRSDLSPALRTLLIILLIATPLAVVILQRLDNIREIMRKRKEGSPSLNLDALFSRPNDQQPQAKIPGQSCPNCRALNPAGQAYCGACGTRLDGFSTDEQKGSQA